MTALFYLAKRVARNLGLVALGAAMAWALALMILQDAAIAAGAFPQPGEVVTPLLAENPLWKAAQTLQTLANASAVVGSLLLLAYGIGERYGPKLTEEITE